MAGPGCFWSIGRRRTPSPRRRTNLAIGFLDGMFGFLGHMLHLEVDWAVFAVIAPAAMAGATLGARQTGRMSPTALKRLMGVVMVVVALALFWVALTRP